MGSQEVVLGLTVLATVLAYALHRRWNFRSKLPPGPPGVPILGNLLQFSPTRPYPQVLRDRSALLYQDTHFFDFEVLRMGAAIRGNLSP